MDEKSDAEKEAAIAAFRARWEVALAMNGVTNAELANSLGEYGHQNIGAWKSRGQIGGPTAPRVIELLPLTDFAWLQYGIGRAERFISDDVIAPANDVRHSSFLRLDPATIRRVHDGLTWRFKTEGFEQGYDLDRDADLFALTYAFVVSGDEADRTAMKVAVDTRIAQLTGETSGQAQEPSRSTRSGPN